MNESLLSPEKFRQEDSTISLESLMIVPRKEWRRWCRS